MASGKSIQNVIARKEAYVAKRKARKGTKQRGKSCIKGRSLANYVAPVEPVVEIVEQEKIAVDE